MLKETEETIVFFVTFLSLVTFQLGGPPAPLATLMFGSLRSFTALQWHGACYFLWDATLAWGAQFSFG